MILYNTYTVERVHFSKLPTRAVIRELVLIIHLWNNKHDDKLRHFYGEYTDNPKRILKSDFT